MASKKKGKKRRPPQQGSRQRQAQQARKSGRAQQPGGSGPPPPRRARGRAPWAEAPNRPGRLRDRSRHRRRRRLHGRGRGPRRPNVLPPPPGPGHYLHLAQAKRHQDLIDRPPTPSEPSTTKVTRRASQRHPRFRRVALVPTRSLSLPPRSSASDGIAPARAAGTSAHVGRLEGCPVDQLKDANGKHREEVAWLRE